MRAASPSGASSLLQAHTGHSRSGSSGPSAIAPLVRRGSPGDADTERGDVGAVALTGERSGRGAAGGYSREAPSSRGSGIIIAPVPHGPEPQRDPSPALAGAETAALGSVPAPVPERLFPPVATPVPPRSSSPGGTPAPHWPQPEQQRRARSQRCLGVALPSCRGAGPIPVPISPRPSSPSTHSLPASHSRHRQDQDSNLRVQIPILPERLGLHTVPDPDPDLLAALRPSLPQHLKLSIPEESETDADPPAFMGGRRGGEEAGPWGRGRLRCEGRGHHRCERSQCGCAGRGLGEFKARGGGGRGICSSAFGGSDVRPSASPPTPPPRAPSGGGGPRERAGPGPRPEEGARGRGAGRGGGIPPGPAPSPGPLPPEGALPNPPITPQGPPPNEGAPTLGPPPNKGVPKPDPPSRNPLQTRGPRGMGEAEPRQRPLRSQPWKCMGTPAGPGAPDSGPLGFIIVRHPQPRG
ncbi:basic salivary proline-rich protein 3-like [Melospiza melodia melodia]|uniref:basic salivary proline-rich protein 3-like n=1 Tax=Melospiza melodia melodia TaxID=1914991 RepID=UPI002FD0E82C